LFAVGVEGVELATVAIEHVDAASGENAALLRRADDDLVPVYRYALAEEVIRVPVLRPQHDPRVLRAEVEQVHGPGRIGQLGVAWSSDHREVAFDGNRPPEATPFPLRAVELADELPRGDLEDVDGAGEVALGVVVGAADQEVAVPASEGLTEEARGDPIGGRQLGDASAARPIEEVHRAGFG